MRALRQRVRLRTRLRRAGARLRRTVPGQGLPAWSDRPLRVVREDGYEQVEAESSGALRRPLTGSARSVRVVVQDWHPPYPGWSGRLGQLPGILHQEVALPPGGHGRAAVTVTLAEAQPLSRVVAAVHPVLEPVRSAPPESAPPDRVTADAAGANPRGRRYYGPKLPAGELGFAPEGDWQVVRVPDGTLVVAGRRGEPLDDRQRAVLAELAVVSWDPSVEPHRAAGAPSPAAGTSPELLVDRPAAAQVLAQLAMTGVVVHAPAASLVAARPGYLSARDLLAPELGTILGEPLPGGDPLDWELRSVRQRREALRQHAAGLTTPAVSALLVTKRPDLARDTVAALAAQTYPTLEIVVCPHGVPAPDGLREAAGGRPVEVVPVPAERNLGEALRTATGAASGALITKVDDDDRYGPEHVWDLVLAHHYSAASVVGKGADFVYLAADDLTVRRRMGSEFYTDVVAGGTLTLRPGDLVTAGGWPAVPRHVDRVLLDRVLTTGGLVYRTHPFGFVYTRHEDGHTWQQERDYFLRDAQRRWHGPPPYGQFTPG